MKRLALAAVLAAFALTFVAASRRLGADSGKPQTSAAARIERGRSLVTFGGCHDCHTPLKMGPNGPEPDMSRALSGHPENLVMPPAPAAQGPWLWSGAATNTAFAGPWGITYTANLTSDKVTGVGGVWTEETFIKTMRTGRHWGVARPIMPPMPWQNLNSLPDEDLKAIFAYLQSTKPVRNTVPDAVLAAPQMASK